MTKSIRLRYKDTSNTLNRYIFADLDHARRWLTQPFVADIEIWLEEVEVGEIHVCRTCGGTGVINRRAKVVRTLSVDEFLNNA